MPSSEYFFQLTVKDYKDEWLEEKNTFPILVILTETCHIVHMIFECCKEYLNNYINQLFLNIIKLNLLFPLEVECL